VIGEILSWVLDLGVLPTILPIPVVNLIGGTKMNAMYSKWLGVGMAFFLMCGYAGASVTLTDDFGDLDYLNNPSWVVVSGTAPSAAEGNLDIPNGTQMSLPFPGSLDNTRCEISFDVWQTTDIGWEGDYDVIIDFRDYTRNAPWGVGYYFKASTSAEACGGSGFAYYDAAESRVAGLAGADLTILPGVVSRLTLSFDPATGVTMKQGDTVVLVCPNFRSVEKMTEFRFISYSGLDWRLDNVAATYNVPEPAMMTLLGLGICLWKTKK